MDYFIVGDIHGCLNTFIEILKRWDPKTQRLIQVGDLVDRGRFIVKTVEFARQLQAKYPDQVTFVLGNHEDEVISLVLSKDVNPWFRSMGGETMTQYRVAGKKIEEDAAWFANLPLFYEDDYVFVSHAGLSAVAEDPYERNELIWHRSPIKDIGKTQVYGHTPRFEQSPLRDPSTHSIDIDTACVYGGKLSALVLDEKGQEIDFISIKVDKRDIGVSYFTGL